MDEYLLKEKQTLITEKIINANYDMQAFFNFCISYKPEKGDDLQNWSLDDLEETIAVFISETNKAQEEERSKNEFHSNTLQQAEAIQLDIAKIKNNKSEEYHSSPYVLEIKCKTLERTVLNNREIHVEISNPKPVETGFFSTNYITYDVTTKETGWTVLRRYSDFVWLRDNLHRFYPRLYIPPLPSKKIGSRRFEIDFVEKRMKFLSKFMNILIQSETFKGTDILMSFLSTTDLQMFKSKMKEISSTEPPKYLEDMKTINGKIFLSNDINTNEKYYTNVTNYFKLQYQLFDRLNYNLKNYYISINAASNSLEDVQKDFEMLHLLNTRVQMREQVTKTYEEIGKFFKNWRRMMLNQNNCIKSYIKDFFKYQQMEGLAYEDLINSREELKNKYEQELSKLTAKKDKLWTTMDISKWEITEDMDKIDSSLLYRDKIYACSKMCTEETNKLFAIQKELQYANKSNVQELRKIIDKNCLSFIVNIKEFSEKMYPSLNDGLTIYADLTSFADVIDNNIVAIQE